MALREAETRRTTTTTPPSRLSKSSSSSTPITPVRPARTRTATASAAARVLGARRRRVGEVCPRRDDEHRNDTLPRAINRANHDTLLLRSAKGNRRRGPRAKSGGLSRQSPTERWGSLGDIPANGGANGTGPRQAQAREDARAAARQRGQARAIRTQMQLGHRPGRDGVLGRPAIGRAAPVNNVSRDDALMKASPATLRS
jgi:hypothetical protein